MKRGIVLGGGGSRGAYQIGVWEALNQLGLEFDVITGTSIGALNGALMVQNEFDMGKKMWEEITYSSVIGGAKEGDLETIDGAARLLKGFLSDIKANGALDVAPLENLVRTYLSEDLVRNSPKEYGFVTVQFPTIKEIEFTKKTIPDGMMADYLLASAACFPIFKTKKIDKTKYVDGGYRNNLPVDMAIRLGADEIIAVDLENMGFIPKVRRFDVPVRFIRSYWGLGLFLNFDESRIRRNMRLGYLDTMKSFNKLEGVAFAFNMGETEKNYNKYGKTMIELSKSIQELVLPDGKVPIEQFLKKKILKALSIKNKKDVYEAKSLCRLAEIAGEIMDMPIAEVYTFDDFNDKLIDIFTMARETTFSFEKIEEILKEKYTAIEMAQKVSEVDFKIVVNYIYKSLDDIITGGERNYNLWIIASVAINQFLAALYLYGIKNRIE